MIYFIEVPLKGRNKSLVKILADRQHRTTPAGPVLGGGRDPCNRCGVDAYASTPRYESSSRQIKGGAGIDHTRWVHLSSDAAASLVATGQPRRRCFRRTSRRVYIHPSQTRTPPVASDVSHTGVIYNRLRRRGITTDSLAFHTNTMNPKCANSFPVFHFLVVGSVR